MLKINDNIVRFIWYSQVFITTSLCFMVSGWMKEWLSKEKVTSMDDVVHSQLWFVKIEFYA
jgi:hypothetical protein